MRALILALTITAVAAPAAIAQPADASVAVEIDAGSAAPPTVTTTTTTTITPADQLHNAATDPMQAVSDVTLARKTSWPLAVWAMLAILGKTLAYGRDKVKTWPVIGKLAAWLAIGKGAMIVAAVGALGAAGYNTLIGGGTLVAALVASGVALAGVTHSTTQDKA